MPQSTEDAFAEEAQRRTEARGTTLQEALSKAQLQGQKVQEKETLMRDKQAQSDALRTDCQQKSKDLFTAAQGQDTQRRLRRSTSWAVPESS